MNNRYNRSYSHVLGSSVRQWKVLDLRRVLEHYNVRPHPRELKAELFIMLGQLAEQRRLTIRDRWTALDAAELRAEQERERCPRCWRQNIVAEGRNRVVCRCRHEYCWQCDADYRRTDREGRVRHDRNCPHHHRNLPR